MAAVVARAGDEESGRAGREGDRAGSDERERAAAADAELARPGAEIRGRDGPGVLRRVRGRRFQRLARILDQRLRRRIARSGIGGHAAGDDAVDRRRQTPTQSRGARSRRVQMPEPHSTPASLRERHAAGEAAIEQRGQRIDVGGRPLVAAEDPLGRHVLLSASGCILEPSGDRAVLAGDLAEKRERPLRLDRAAGERVGERFALGGRLTITRLGRARSGSHSSMIHESPVERQTGRPCGNA